MPAGVLSQEDVDSSMTAKKGAAPGIIYARGVPPDPSSDMDSFDRKVCSLILFEFDLCRELGCHKKLKEKN